jgi:hypothetical protein
MRPFRALGTPKPQRVQRNRMHFPKLPLRDTIGAFTLDAYGERLTFEHD